MLPVAKIAVLNCICICLFSLKWWLWQEQWSPLVPMPSFTVCHAFPCCLHRPQQHPRVCSLLSGYFWRLHPLKVQLWEHTSITVHQWHPEPLQRWQARSQGDIAVFQLPVPSVVPWWKREQSLASCFSVDFCGNGVGLDTAWLQNSVFRASQQQLSPSPSHYWGAGEFPNHLCHKKAHGKR